MNKTSVTEQDIRSKFTSPAIHAWGWDAMRRVREEVQLTKGPVLVMGKLASRGTAKRADHVLYHSPTCPSPWSRSELEQELYRQSA